MAQRTSVWRNSFKTFRQFGETIIMVLIANIRSDVIQILVRLYFITYATVTAKFRITKMTTRSLARRHIRQGLSFALYDGSHAINTTAVVPVYFSALLFMLRIANYSFVYSFNVRVTFKTNEGVCKETTEWLSTPQFSTCL